MSRAAALINARADAEIRAAGPEIRRRLASDPAVTGARLDLLTAAAPWCRDDRGRVTGGLAATGMGAAAPR